MTTPHDKALQATANELLAHGEFGTFEEANRRNAVSAAGAAISAYLSSIGGVVCAVKPVCWICNGEGDGWKETNVITFDQQTAQQRVASSYWSVTPLHIPIEAGNGGDGWLPIETAPKDGIKIDVGVLSRWGFERHCDIWWSAKRDSWVFWGDNGFERYGEVRISFDPTHWRPLPSPPSSSNEGKKP